MAAGSHAEVPAGAQGCKYGPDCKGGPKGNVSCTPQWLLQPAVPSMCPLSNASGDESRALKNRAGGGGKSDVYIIKIEDYCFS